MHDSSAFVETKSAKRFSIWNLLGLTTLCALLLGIGRLLGPRLSFSCFLACYAFAPAIAMLIMWCLREYDKNVQLSAAGITLLCFAVSMALISAYYYGSEAIPFVLVGTLIEWPGQIGVLVCLRWIGVSAGRMES